jgi:hypothetical protein
MIEFPFGTVIEGELCCRCMHQFESSEGSVETAESSLLDFGDDHILECMR